MTEVEAMCWERYIESEVTISQRTPQHRSDAPQPAPQDDPPASSPARDVPQLVGQAP